jgi:prepilin-type processing-associated H-X9-DG protein
MPTQYTCPHCGGTTELAEADAARTGVCVHCGKFRDCRPPLRESSVEPPGDIVTAGDTTPNRRRSPFLGFSWRSLGCAFLFIFFIIGFDLFGVFLSLFLPAVQAAREAARRTQCAANMRQIGLAMQAYQQKYGRFPPSFIPDENGNPKHSWRVLLLPFLGESNLYSQYRFDEPWNGPHNRTLNDQMPRAYRCPTDAAPDQLQTSYAMIVGPHAISNGPASHRMQDIKDAPSNTILLIEAGGTGIDWMEPRDLNADKLTFRASPTANDLPPKPDEVIPCHGAIANALFCDGSVRTLSIDSLRPEQLKALMTIDGGDAVPALPPAEGGNQAQ